MPNTGKYSNLLVTRVLSLFHSWYQPAIDAMTLSLSQHFNKLDQSREVQPLVYGTYQAYLRRYVSAKIFSLTISPQFTPYRTQKHLLASLYHAKVHNYALGVKLVRGAYHPYEISAHNTAMASRIPSNQEVPSTAVQAKIHSPSISPEELPPVWSSKAETDACYNACAKLLINAVQADIIQSHFSSATTSVSSWIRPWTWGSSSTVATNSSPKRPPQIGVLFGTHNWDSCNLIVDELLKSGLAISEPSATGDIARLLDPLTERVTIGQLYGTLHELSSNPAPHSDHSVIKV